MAVLEQWKNKFAEDKPKSLIMALAVVAGLVLAGWGVTTWLSLRPEPVPPPARPSEKPRTRDLAFLDPAPPEKFVITGGNPFYAPYIPPPSPGKSGGTPPPRGRGWQPPSSKGSTAAPAAVSAGPTYKNIELVYKGAMVGNDGKPVALVQDKSSGQSHFVRVGDAVQGGNVTAFNNGALVWEKSGNRVELKLGEGQVIGQVKLQ